MSCEEINTNREDTNKVIFTWDNVVKSSEDKREYRGIKLQNQMKVLLVSDPTTDISAAGLCVNVGSFTDPDDLQGLAHFCEHMLFLGNEKYPEENAYTKFLSEHGGNYNAETGSDRTTYYFDVIPEHLDAALDMFSQFFISPLFTVSCTDRELQAVNLEHKSYICSDVWRLNQLNKFLSSPEHPFHKFGTGNKATLKKYPKKNGINVQSELLKYHSYWYSANIMSLIIFGKESLNELEKLAIDKFLPIKNKGVQVPEWPGHPFTEDYLGIQVNIVPIEDIRKLNISFPLPDLTTHYKGNPVKYICYLFAHEGPGSLFSLLKENGWCDALNSSSYNDARGFGIFNIDIDLTEKGMNHTEDIVNLVFEYINLLRKKGIQEWIFNEQARISDIEFRFQDKEDPLDFVTSYIHNIFDYPMEHVLSADHILSEFKPELIKEILDMLTPERIRISIIGKLFEPICALKEKWYGTKFNLEIVSRKNIEKWSSCGLNEKLALPLPNSFIPDCLDLIPPDPESKEFPTIIYDSPIMRIWYKQDDEYFLPKSNCFFKITSPIAYLDPLNSELNEIFILLLLDLLTEYTYAAELAGLNYSILNDSYGLVISVTGFDSKQHILLEHIVEKIVSFKVDPKNFDIKKEHRVRLLKNFETTVPYTQSFIYMETILNEKLWTVKDRLQVIDNVTIENLEYFIKSLLLKVNVECLIHGNISKQKAIDLAMIIEKNLPENVIPLLPQQLMLTRQIQLETGNYRLEIDHKIYPSSCTLLYFQCGLQSTLKNILLELLLDIINEPCFDILRTKEQLGYTVDGNIRCKNGVQGLIISVQSQKHPAEVESRIQAFLHHMDSYILNQSNEEFENHRESVIADKLERPKQLLQRSEMFLSEINNKQYNFDRVNVEVEALRNVTKAQLYDFYKDILAISSPNRKYLGIHIISSAEGGVAHPETLESSNSVIDDSIVYLSVQEDETEVTLIENLTVFKAERSLFPLFSSYIDIPLNRCSQCCFSQNRNQRTAFNLTVTILVLLFIIFLLIPIVCYILIREDE